MRDSAEAPPGDAAFKRTGVAVLKRNWAHVFEKPYRQSLQRFPPPGEFQRLRR